MLRLLSLGIYLLGAVPPRRRQSARMMNGQAAASDLKPTFAAHLIVSQRKETINVTTHTNLLSLRP